MDGETDSTRQDDCPIFQEKARTDFEPGHFVERDEVVAEAAGITFIIDKVRKIVEVHGFLAFDRFLVPGPKHGSRCQNDRPVQSRCQFFWRICRFR